MVAVFSMKHQSTSHIIKFYGCLELNKANKMVKKPKMWLLNVPHHALTNSLAA